MITPRYEVAIEDGDYPRAHVRVAPPHVATDEDMVMLERIAVAVQGRLDERLSARFPIQPPSGPGLILPGG